jgi:hypothetical protein
VCSHGAISDYGCASALVNRAECTREQWTVEWGDRPRPFSAQSFLEDAGFGMKAATGVDLQTCERVNLALDGPTCRKELEDTMDEFSRPGWSSVLATCSKENPAFSQQRVRAA